MDNERLTREAGGVYTPLILTHIFKPQPNAGQDTQDSYESAEMALFRPPIHRSAAAVLDRALFSKTIPIAAARVTDRKQISRCRTQLDKSRELLHLERLPVVRDDPDPVLASKGGKCLLLKPEVKPDGNIYGLDKL